MTKYEPKLLSLNSLTAEQKRARKWWHTLIESGKDSEKGGVERNAIAFDVAVARRKRDAERGGLENPWVFMPKPRGEKQRRVPGSFKPFAVSSGDRFTVGNPLDRATRDSRHDNGI